MQLLVKAAEVCFPACPPLVQRLRDLADHLLALHLERNFLAHGRWNWPRKGPPECIRVSDGDWGRIDRRRFDVPSIQTLAQQIGEAAARIHILMDPLGHWSLSADERAALRDFQAANIPPALHRTTGIVP